MAKYFKPVFNYTVNNESLPVIAQLPIEADVKYIEEKLGVFLYQQLGILERTRTIHNVIFGNRAEYIATIMYIPERLTCGALTISATDYIYADIKLNVNGSPLRRHSIPALMPPPIDQPTIDPTMVSPSAVPNQSTADQV